MPYSVKLKFHNLTPNSIFNCKKTPIAFVIENVRKFLYPTSYLKEEATSLQKLNINFFPFRT